MAAKKFDKIRITGEGDLSFKLLDISIEADGFIGSSAVIAHRPGISDDLVYHYMVANELLNKRSAIIFPLVYPVTLPFDPQPELLDLKEISWESRIEPGKSYRLSSSSDALGVRYLAKFRKWILHRSNKNYPIIFIIDTLQPLSAALDKELRVLIREAPLNRLSIWLHCPLSCIPSDLLSIIGNVAVIWPSKREYDIMRENLPADNIDLNGIRYDRGMLFVSNFILSEGKGWQFSKMEYEDL